MSKITVKAAIGGKELIISAGHMAGQANGAVQVEIGDTTALVTAAASQNPREGVNFFPLTIDVEERMYAVGRIPGSFFRREGRATERATLSARLIDRPLRPSFRDGFRNDTHVVATILQVDGENAYDVPSLNGASAALSISDIPFEGPLGAVRLGLRNGEWVPFPTFTELEECVFDLVVAGKRNAAGQVDIVMVEAGATDNAMDLIAGGQPASNEETVAAGLEEAKTHIGTLVDIQSDLQAQVGKETGEWPVFIEYAPETLEKVAEAAAAGVSEVIRIADKSERNQAQSDLKERITEQLAGETAAADEEAPAADEVGRAFGSLVKTMMRERLLEEGVRIDGRSSDEIRPLSAQVGVLNRAHGSSIFTRGETQVLNVLTLGMPRMEQMLDTISNEETKRYMHHYNFPPYSTGEAGFMRGPKRREIGHGALAEKAVKPVVPRDEEFHYTLRLVSEVLSSNGSSSMASVCASALSLMDAGVEIDAPVAGIAMGLVAEGDRYVTLTDILGAEDALGDMDFKVAGTADVITALQLDMKIDGLPSEVLAGALAQAKEARLAVLEVMAEAIDAPRSELREFAPRLESVKVPMDKIGEVIGPKGKVIRELEQETGADIEVQEDGTVLIAADQAGPLQAAMQRVRDIAFPPEAELNMEYDGTVVGITDFGAFINILPGRDGLLHISKMDANRRVQRVRDYLEEGDALRVLVDSLDRGKVSLSLVGELSPKPGADLSDSATRGPRRDDRGGGRRDDRGGPRRDDRGPRRDNRGGPRRDDRGGGRRDDRGPRRDDRRDDRGGPRRDDRAPRRDDRGGNRRFASFEDEFSGGR